MTERMQLKIIYLHVTIFCFISFKYFHITISLVENTNIQRYL